MRRGFPLATRGQTIGLLGGTFDPAHEGHRHIAETAQERLGLDRVWWMVTPQNPLKPKATPLVERLASARRMARGRRHVVTDFEELLGVTYTIDTIGALQALYPGVAFVLLLGGDNLLTFHRWRRWREIQARLPIAVISRPLRTSGAGARSRLALAFASVARVGAEDARGFARLAPPVWTYLTAPYAYVSSTALRTRTGSPR